MSLPLHMVSELTDTRTKGTFIIRTKSPRFVGRVVMDGDKVRVVVHEAWDEMDDAQSLKLCLEMKNWYYFKYIQKK